MWHKHVHCPNCNGAETVYDERYYADISKLEVFEVCAVCDIPLEFWVENNPVSKNQLPLPGLNDNVRH